MKYKNFLGFFESILQLIYVPKCLTCQEGLFYGEKFICTSCRYSLPKIGFRQSDQAILREKFYGHIPFDQIHVFLQFFAGGAVQKIMHAIKYQGNRVLGEEMGRWMAIYLLENEINLMADLIIPIPLAPSRRRERGYNQAEAIARGISSILTIPLETQVLCRKEGAKSLVKLNKRDRKEELKEVFYLKNQDKIVGKKILLVDDTLTTGATLISASEVLWEQEIQGLTLICLSAVK